MKLTIIPVILLLVASMRLINLAHATPTTVAGNTFVLVATNGSGIELYGLAQDDQGNIYAGNNSNGSGIPLQKFTPSDFSNAPIALVNFGPTCDDGDGLAYGQGYLYVASLQGVRQISVTNGDGTLFIPNVADNVTGSPLVWRATDGHLFVGEDSPEIDEYDANGNFVTSHSTATDVETMTFNPSNGMIYYAPYGSDVHSLNPTNDNDTVVATVDGQIDGALAYDPISQDLFVGTANGSNQGNVYTVSAGSSSAVLFATGFQGSLGILRERLTGDLYFLEDQNLYRLDGSAVTNTLEPKLTIFPAVELGWNSNTNLTYQVQYTTALNTNTWINFGSPIQGNGSTNYVFDAATNPQRFYRLTIVP